MGKVKIKQLLDICKTFCASLAFVTNSKVIDKKCESGPMVSSISLLKGIVYRKISPKSFLISGEGVFNHSALLEEDCAMWKIGEERFVSQTLITEKVLLDLKTLVELLQDTWWAESRLWVWVKATIAIGDCTRRKFKLWDTSSANDRLMLAFSVDTFAMAFLGVVNVEQLVQTGCLWKQILLF